MNNITKHITDTEFVKIHANEDIALQGRLKKIRKRLYIKNKIKHISNIIII